MESAIRLILVLLWSVLWGLAADRVMKNKGYDNNWFWWGFFFGWIAVLIALTKPDIKPQYSDSPYFKAETEKKKREEQLQAGYWQCSCGSFNPPYCTTCVCGKTPKDVAAEKRLVKDEQAEDEELKKIKLLKEYKELLDSGTITQAEFEKKKANILNH